MRKYELTFIIHPEVEEKEVESVVEKVRKIIGDDGGKVTDVNHWGRRRLAYPIKKQLEGYYVVMRVELEPSAINELERKLSLTEEVIRHLLVRTEG
jgi:small subunit ribosomal protein S6